MLGLRFTAKFKKDYKRVKRQGKDLSKLESTLEALARGEALPDLMRDHPLGGTYRGHRECHIEPDWLLIYLIDEEGLVLEGGCGLDVGPRAWSGRGSACTAGTTWSSRNTPSRRGWARDMFSFTENRQ